MQLKEYQNIFEQEDIHWWYKSLRDLVSSVLNKLLGSSKSSLIILDAGCGTGGTLSVFKKKYPLSTSIGIDISSYALSYCRQRGIDNLLQASVEHLPFAEESVDIVISLDVLYHSDVYDDEKSLRESFRVLKRGGYIILHLAAFEFLRGRHDLAVRTRERYSKVKIHTKLEKAGFEIIKCTYRQMILFPVLFLKRITDRTRIITKGQSDLRPLPTWVNNFLSLVSYCENRFINYFNLPLGSSLFCLAKKRQ